MDISRFVKFCTIVSVIETICFFATTSSFAADTKDFETDCPRVTLSSAISVDKLAINTIAEQNQVGLFRAMSQLWLNKDIQEANETLRKSFRQVLGESKKLTPEIADENFKWQMRMWIRVYGLFNSYDGWFASRLEPETEATFHELFWNYALAKSTLDRTHERYTWFVQGSENHDLMDLSNAFLALEALSNVPEFADRKLRDGKYVDEHVKAWNAHYRRYADSRVKSGLLIECASSIYGKYSIPELTNMSDFADDPILRRKMTMLLDVIWADWAGEQIDGIRGGGKSRVYQGKYSRFGDRDCYGHMGDVLLGRGNWTHGKHGHTNSGYIFCLATSRYRLPQVVANVAVDRPALPYASISRRPAKMTGVEKLPDYQPHPCWYVMDVEDTRAVRYTYCNSDYVMGSWWVDPGLGESCIVKDGKHEWGNAHYAAIHAQNRWQGIVFKGDPQARIYPQCFSKRLDKNDASESVTNHQHLAVQHQNVMLVQANLKRKPIEAMRVYFAPSTQRDLIEYGPWLVTKVGDAYTAVAALNKRAKFMHGEWRGDFFHLDDMRSVVMIVAGTTQQFGEMKEFADYLTSFDVQSDEQTLTIGFQDNEGRSTQLDFDATQEELPRINGSTIDLNPQNVYDSPLMRSKFGSGVVTIGDGQSAFVWNIQNNSILPLNR